VNETGLASPTGTVSFLVTSNGNSVLGTAALGTGASALGWLNSQTPPTGSGPSSVVVGDFNGDGIPDLAVANAGSTSTYEYYLTILLGNGDGTFTATAASPLTGAYPSSIAAGDFNGDGIPDLAVADYVYETLTILLGNGDGTFTATAVSPATGNGPASVAVGDFNGDGIPDLAVANYYSNTVTILLGNGDGTFTGTTVNLAPGGAPISLAVGDFNGDGKADLAVANYEDDTVTILLGKGDGTFTATTESPATGTDPFSVAVGDFNGDGKADLAVANKNDGNAGTLTILLGNRDGTFTPTAASPATGNGPESVAVGDFNGDGIPDLAVVNNNDGNAGTLTILLGNGDGTFTPAAVSPATGNGSDFVAVGDFHGGGVSDMAVANYKDNTATVLLTENRTATAKASGIAPMGSGTHLVEASYPGDSNFSSSVSGTTTITVEPVSFSPTSLIFSPQNVGVTSAPQTVTVTNTGTANLTFLTITIGGTNASDFGKSADTCSGATVTPNNTCTVSVTFTPSATGSRSASLNFNDNASNSPQTVGLSGRGINPKASLSASSLTWGDQLINTTSTTVNIESVTNSGTTALIFSTVTIGGTNASDFAQSADTCTGATLLANATCAVSVTFTPSATGARSASLNFADNASNSPQAVSLSGTGIASVVSLSGSSLSFANQLVGTTSTAQAETVTNTGTANLTISTVAIGGTNASDFAKSGDTCSGATVTPNSTCTVSVTFTPSATGSRSASLNFTDNASNSPQTVPLSGTGTAPAVSLSTTSVSFGNQLVGTTSAASAVTVTNNGTASLTFTSIAVTGDFAIAASGTTCNTSAPVAASSNCVINVTFTPTAAGSRSGSLTLTDNASGSPQVVGLSGTGTAPSVSLSTTSVSFGNQPVGTTSAASAATVTNNGTANLAISTVTMGGTNVSDFATSADNCTGATVIPNGACTVSVTFTPSAPGSRSASLNFTDNASNSPQTVSLSGTGTAPLVSLSAPSLSFGNQPLSTTSAAQPETVTNTGTVNLTISTVTMGGTNASDFAKSADTCTGATVTPNGTCAVSVTFAPSATGTRSASLNFNDNASGSPQTVSLSGTGTAPTVSLSAPPTFPSEPVGTTSPSQTVTLTNTANASLTFTAIGVTGPFAIAVSGTTCSTSSPVAASGSCTVAVTFTPTTAGTVSGSLSFSDNAPNSPQTVALSGTGQDFTLAAASGTSTSATVAPGSPASYTLSVAGQGGFSASVSFTCTGVPSEATCTVSPSPLTPGSSATNVTVSVTTTAPSVSLPRSRPLPPLPPLSPGLRGLLMLAMVLALMAWAIGRREQPGVSRRRSTMVPLASALLLTLALAGCGGGGSSPITPPSNPGTPAGNYTLTVTGTAGSGSAALSHSVTLTLNVS